MWIGNTFMFWHPLIKSSNRLSGLVRTKPPAVKCPSNFYLNLIGLKINNWIILIHPTELIAIVVNALMI